MALQSKARRHAPLSWLLRPKVAFWVVFSAHLALAIYYQAVVGLDILANPGNRPWDWWWQNIPQDLLVGDLWRSLWYLHTQPPLYNLYGAIFFNLVPGQPMAAMQFSNMVLGAVLSGMIYLILGMSLEKRLLAFMVGLGLAFDPGLFLFEAYILYDLVTTFFVVATVCTLAAYVRTHRVVFGVLFIAALSTLILVRSAYHLLLLPIGIVLVALAIPRRDKALVVAALMIALAPGGWYLKNYALYGFFGASSWQGFSIWKVVSQSYSTDQLVVLRDQGIIEPVAAEVEPWRSASQYVQYGFTATSEIPVLSRDDRQNINMVEAARAYQRSAINLALRDPELYLQSAFRSYLIYNMPAAQFKHHVRNIEKIPYHASFWSKIVQGNYLERFVRFPIGSVFFVLIPFCLVSYTAVIGYELLARRKRPLDILRLYSVDTWIVLLIAYTTLIGTFLEVGENNREKFYIEQLVIVYCLTLAVRVYSSRLSWKQNLSRLRTRLSAGSRGRLRTGSFIVRLASK